MTLTDRFDLWTIPEPNSGCLLWLGHLSIEGYGRFKHDRKREMAHRFAYEQAFGPVPAGLTLDHLCRVRSCVNPKHLEPVTMKENGLRGLGPTALNFRKTHCKRGHLLAGDNLYPYPNQRHCRPCARLRAKLRRAA
jgi:hypothetical protein